MFILKNNPSLRIVRQMRRDFGATCTQKGTRVTKFLAGAHYTQALGRSMVEMLGVLAIIGVLSVGAIAGYSKAMMKYKLNQYAQAVNMLINNGLQIKDRLPHTYYSGTIFYKLNLLPDGIKYISDFALKDSWFKNNITIYYNTGSDGIPYGGIRFNFQASNEGSEICRTAVYAAKEYKSDLWIIETYKFLNNGALTSHGWIYGDKYCIRKNDKCLRNLSLADVDDMCNSCTEKDCALFVLWRTGNN